MGRLKKILEKYKEYKNNFVAASTIFTDQSNLLIFYPTLIKRKKINQNFKFVYISENKQVESKKSLDIWQSYKKEILENFKILDDITFWDKIIDTKNELAQKIYIDIKSLVRSELVCELNKTLHEKFILVGSNWKNKYPKALENNYSDKFIEDMYSGNICIDFGSKNSEKCIYPRSCKIIESGGLLFQSIHKDSENIFKDLFSKTCFISLNDMKKIDYF